MTEDVAIKYIEGDYSVVVAIIGVLGSILVAYVTALITAKNEQNKIRHAFVEKLYERRLESYTKLLKITQEIGKNVHDIELHTKARENIKLWQVETDGYLLLSKKSLNELNILKDILKKNPEKKNSYSETQREKIFYARNSLRGSLRSDFDFIHNSEEKLHL